MPILTVNKLSLGLGPAPLLDNLRLQLEPGERVCLVGRNGAGKSTLLRLVAGEIAPDEGEIVRAPGLRVATLAQEVPLGTTGTVFHVVAGGLGEAGALLERYHALTLAVGEDAALLPELERCQQALEHAGGWDLNQRVETVLSRLDLDADAELAQLSGGTQRRVMLARALVAGPDLLLLDEPTNHLDIASILWLEEFLLGYKGCLLFITHDRAFLERLATRIVELDRGRLSDFPGDYAAYRARKAAMLAEEERHDALFDKRLAQEEAWIRQGIKARRTRNEGRVRALERLREERAARRTQTGAAKLALQEAERSGRVVVEAENVGFDYDGHIILRDLSTTIMRGDKVGIIGPNGAGKTTLLRLLLGELAPARGKLKHGTHLSIAYFDQYRAALDPEKTVQENLDQGRDTVEIDGRRRHVLSYLQDFLFTPERARQPVKTLSGGERNRLLLARLFLRAANVLVLDEPTNDLDADTLELLEARLVEYQGTVLLVSHDRAFLDEVVTSTLVFEGDGVVHEYIGGYGDAMRQSAARAPQPAPAAAPARSAPAAQPARRPAKLSYKDQRELDALPALIETLERERNGVHAHMGTPAYYQQDKDAIARDQARLMQLESEIAAAYVRWEMLEEQRS